MRVQLGKVRPVYLVSLVVVAAVGTCALFFSSRWTGGGGTRRRPPSPPRREAQKAFVVRDGAKGSVIVGGQTRDDVFRYGEELEATCAGAGWKDCVMRRPSDGAIIELTRGDVSFKAIPRSTQFAARRTGVYPEGFGVDARTWLREGQRVDLVEFDVRKGDQYAKIRSPEGYVALKDLQDHPMTKEERAIAIEQAAAERKMLAQAREAKILARQAYGPMLRERYLDQNLDIKVRISGKAADRITLEYVLFNDVWSHKMKDSPLISEIRDLGFRRLDMENGYDWHIYWDFK